MGLDLSRLGDVRRFATEFRARFDRLDVLVANAGVCTCVRGRDVRAGCFIYIYIYIYNYK
jgi:NAD(P)-dependent dehydrogenase (short-subunit alcohol dehydrogenase family)